MPISSWWQLLQLRPEIIAANGSIDDVQMSLFGALHGFAGQKPPYSDALYYGQITHPSRNLVELLANIAVRLAAPEARRAAAPAVFRLAQGMGGGKSHGLVGLWHLAAHPQAFAQTDIGQEALALAAQMVGSALPQDLGTPRVVVLACDNMTAGVGNPLFDGPTVSLHERFLWRLFEGDQALFQKFQPHFADKSQLANALRAVNTPVLILVDEIMDYVRQLSTSSNADLATRDMAFLKALCDTVNDVAGAAMVVVMISSETDTMALDAAGVERRTELSDQLDRNGKPATVTSNTDFAAILRRRLFQDTPDEAAVNQTAQAFWDAMKGPWSTKVWNEGIYSNASEWSAAVARCYPFHPSLIELGEREWSRIAGFQRVRSTIRIFAATTYVLQRNAQDGEWTPLLIGTGDLPLSSSTVRESLLGSGLIVDEATAANFRQVAANDVVSDDDNGGLARGLDIARQTPWNALNPRAAQRMATALFGFSIMGPRSQGRQGATETELKAAAFVPDVGFGYPDAQVVLEELKHPDAGLGSLEHIPSQGSQASRLFLSTRQTVRMLARANRSAISDEERDDTFAQITESLLKSGQFSDKKFVPVSQAEMGDGAVTLLRRASLDDARKTRLVALDPRKFSLLNGRDSETRQALQAAFGLGPQPFSVAWASSLVFAVVNTQRRDSARQKIYDYIAWQRVCALESVRSSPEQLAEARKQFADIKDRTEKAIRAAFQHVIYLCDNDGTRAECFRRFESDDQSALNGSLVWAELVEKEKAFGAGGFTAKALEANLTPQDCFLPLDELRDSFWNTPRMPLLGGGEKDLQNAIYEAIKNEKLVLARQSGEEVACNAPSDINLSNTSLRLHFPDAEEPSFDIEDPKPDGGGTSPTAPKPTPPITDPTQQVKLGFTINVRLDEANRSHAWELFQKLASALDSGASSVQATVKVSLSPDDADGMTDPIKALGGNPSRDVF